jgi:hypothetical protein
MKSITMLFVLFVVVCCSATVSVAEVSEALINAVGMHESHNKDSAIGDKHLTDKAYGRLQTRQPAVDDYNRWCGTSYRAEDCLGNPELSAKIFRKYVSMYATEKRLGRAVTDEDCARIWNGGPSGWKKSSTKTYWAGVQKYLPKG